MKKIRSCCMHTKNSNWVFYFLDILVACGLSMPSEKLLDLRKCKLRLLNHRNVLINVFTMSPVLFLTVLIN